MTGIGRRQRNVKEEQSPAPASEDLAPSCDSYHQSLSLRERQEKLDFRRDNAKRANTGPGLCESCSNLDLEAIFSLPGCVWGKEGLPICDLSYLFSKAEKAPRHCQMCQLFRDVLRGVTFGPCHLRACDSLQILGASQDDPQSHIKSSTVLAVIEGAPLKYLDWGTDKRGRYVQAGNLLEGLCRGVITPLATKRYQLQSFDMGMTFKAYEVCPDVLPYDSLREWIETCNQSDDESGSDHHWCRKVAASCGPKYVIDVRKAKIERWDGKAPYVCLSYVWGMPEMRKDPWKNSRINGELSIPNLPRTIQDAIRVVERLGLQYIWIDCYCINHDLVQESTFEIQHMDDIYEGALTTMVALGPDAEYGLPGVSRPRRQQVFAHVNGIKYASTLPDLPSQLQQSKWRSRGWTYQEGLLSHRCLFFTDDQVFFSCKGGTLRESVQISHAAFALGEDRSLDAVLSNVRLPRELKGHDYAGERFNLRVEDYTRKKLTYISDSHNAFRGILGRADVYTYYGVPFRAFPAYNVILEQKNNPPIKEKRRDCNFARGLIWRQVRELPRVEGVLRSVEGLPSWSWVSACCAVDYDIASKVWEQEKPDTTAEFSVTNGNGELVRLVDQPLQPGKDSALVESSSPILYILTFTIQVKLRIEMDRHGLGSVYADLDRPLLQLKKNSWFPNADPGIQLDPSPWTTLKDGKLVKMTRSCTAVFLYSFKKHNFSTNSNSEYCHWLLVEKETRKGGVYVRRGTMSSFYRGEKKLPRKRRWIKIG